MGYGRLSVLAGMLAAVALLPGCGGGDMGPSTSSTGGSGGVLISTGSSQFTIDLSGGNSNTGLGGAGGTFDTYIYGTRGIEIGTRGTIDTRFSFPADPPVAFGAEALVATSSLTIGVWDTVANGRAAVADDEYFMAITSTLIYRRIDASSEATVTGIDVRAGVTLALGLNSSQGGATGQDTAYVSVSNDIRVAGTLAVKSLDTGNVGGLTVETRHSSPATSRDSGGLSLDCAGLLVTRTGRIDTSGDDYGASDERGGDGGWFGVVASYGSVFTHGTVDCSGGDGDGAGEGGHGARGPLDTDDWGLDVYSDAAMLNTGTLDTSGGGAGLTGAAGGDAGYVELDPYNFCYSTGPIRANGGSGSTGDGGDASYVDFYSYASSAFNSGRIEASGGSSTDGDGGAGGPVGFYVGYDGYIGDIRNSGDIVANGGSSTNGSGGSAALVYMEAYGGDVRSVAAMTLNGGSGAMTGGASGGDGGDFKVWIYEGLDYGWQSYGSRPGDVMICGSIGMSGGDGDTAGAGGNIRLYDEWMTGSYFLYENDYGLAMHGYGSVAARGGDGTGGGAGGSVDLLTYSAEALSCTPPGPIEVQAALDLSGGDGDVGGVGGTGGAYRAETSDGPGYGIDESSIFFHTGSVDVSGGDGVTSGGDAGEIYVYGYGLADFLGSVDGLGGSGTGTDAAGGDGTGSAGNYFELYSSCNVYYEGTVNISGGSGTGAGAGGQGGELYFYAGGQVISTAHYDASGGDTATGAGGGGGYIDIFGEAMTTDHLGSFDVSGGAGGTTGATGAVYIDWIDYTP